VLRQRLRGEVHLVSSGFPTEKFSGVGKILMSTHVGQVGNRVGNLRSLLTSLVGGIDGPSGFGNPLQEGILPHSYCCGAGSPNVMLDSAPNLR